MSNINITRKIRALIATANDGSASDTERENGSAWFKGCW